MTQQEGQAVLNILRDNIRDDYSEARPDRRVLPRRAGRTASRLKEDRMKKHLQPLTPAALYARVSSDRQNVDLSVSAQRGRAPKVRRPARVGSRFLLSGLLKCGVCGRPYSAQGAKSGQFAYYICGTLFREGAGTCSARYLNAPRVEDFVVEKIRERILTEETIVELVKLVAEEVDAMAGGVGRQVGGRRR